MAARLFPAQRRRQSADLCAQLDDVREALVPFMGRGVATWHPVKIRPSLRFAMVPAPRKRAEPGETSDSLQAHRLHRKRWPVLAPPPGGPGFIEGADFDASPQDVPQPPPRLGLQGLTDYGAGRIEDLCALFNRENRCFAFWTVTLPPAAAAAMEMKGIPWSKFQDTIRRRFGEALRRASRSGRSRRAAAGRIPPWLFVVEAQKNGRPHLHFVFRARWHSGAQWFLSRRRLDGLIANALAALLGHQVEVGSAGNVQRVKRGLGRYLSKYLGKAAGTSQVDLIFRGGYGLGMVPVRWWGCCDQCRLLLMRYTFPLPNILANLLSLRRAELQEGGWIRSRIYEPPGDGAPTVVVGEWRGGQSLREALKALADEATLRLGLPLVFGVT